MGDNTSQDDLLAKINGLTSGMVPDMPAPAPAPAPVPAMEQPAPAPAPEAPAPAPAMEQPAMPSMPTPEPVNNIMQAPSMPMSQPVAPEMPVPGVQDSFAASLGATPAMPTMDQPAESPAPQTDAQNNGGSRIPVPDNKIPTFDKPSKKKKSNGGFAFLVVVLILAIIGFGIFALYTNGKLDGIINKFAKQPVVEEPIIDDTFVNVDPEPVNEVKFIDNTKTAGETATVIKADYDMENLEYTKENIQLPYINLTTPDAKSVNEEMQSLYQTLANKNAEYLATNKVNLTDSSYKQKYVVANFETATNGDIVSVLVNTLDYDGTNDAMLEQRVYNISASTGKKLELSDIETLLTVDDNALNSAYETYIPKLISQSTAQEAKLLFEHKINTYKTLEAYYNNINNKSGIGYFVDAQGKIEVIMKMFIGKNEIYRAVVYDKTAGCSVKYYPINDIKTKVGYKPLEANSEITNDNNNGEAVATTASSNLLVSAKDYNEYNTNDIIKGSDLLNLYTVLENKLGKKDQGVTFQVVNKVGSKSYSNGDENLLAQDVISEGLYELNVTRYDDGNYRIIKASLYSY
ncbi:MAG: hypothetical protein MJ245_01370 [Clostridia bacterium]|nr:hypothetical protein [Clostridia bacterium]